MIMFLIKSWTKRLFVTCLISFVLAWIKIIWWFTLLHPAGLVTDGNKRSFKHCTLCCKPTSWTLSVCHCIMCHKHILISHVLQFSGDSGSFIEGSFLWCCMLVVCAGSLTCSQMYCVHEMGWLNFKRIYYLTQWITVFINSKIGYFWKNEYMFDLYQSWNVF